MVHVCLGKTGRELTTWSRLCHSANQEIPCLLWNLYINCYS